MINRHPFPTILIASLAFLGGCQKAGFAELKKNHPISFYDDTQEIDNVRVSCKHMAYNKKHDCTLIKLSVNNQTDTSCMFGPTDINLQLVTHENAQRIYDTYNNKGKRIGRSIGYGMIGFIAGFAPAFLFLLGALIADNDALLRNIGLGIMGTGAAIGSRLGYRERVKYNPKSKSYFSQGSPQKVVFGNEQDAVMLCVQGRTVKNLDFTLHSSASTRQFNLYH